VVAGAVALYVRVEILMGGRGIRLHAEDLQARLRVTAPSGLVYDGSLDLHKAALNMLPVTGGLEVLTRSDVPAGSGLGASGALDVALLAALAECRQERYQPVELAELGFLLETSELKLLGGRQDQYAASLGGFTEMAFNAGGASVRPLAVTAEMARDLERHLVLVYTGESHFSSRTHERVWRAYQAGEPEVTGALRAIRDLATPAASALERGDWRELSRIVDENWVHQQRLDATMSTPGTARIEAAARGAGAWGMKATGAGAGGCLAVFAPADRRAAVGQAVTAEGARILDGRFDFDGVKVWSEGEVGGDPE
jgi:D-glycero-alpha-D-manno-heptose-7-phosphate kinase